MTKDNQEELIEGIWAIAARMASPNVCDSNLEPANLVDTTDRIASGLFAIAKAINGLSESIKAIASK